MKKIIDNISKDYKDWAWGEAFDGTKPNVFKFLVSWIKVYAMALICKYKNHDWESGSDIGPDTGREWCECKRCGLYYQETYY